MSKNSNLIDFSDKKQKTENAIDDKTFEEILCFAEKCFSRQLSTMQSNVLKEAYYDMKLPVEVILYLIEYVSKCDVINSKYIETIAVVWCEKGIRTREEAEEYVNSFKNNKRDKEEIKVNLYSDKVREKGEEIFSKYKNNRFDFKDAINIFFNPDEETNAVFEYLKTRLLLDVVQVAFDNPESTEKTNFIKNRFGKKDYDEFLNTPYWKIIADYKKLIGKCESCSSTMNLNVHHEFYEDLHGYEHLSENINNRLSCYCKKCHVSIHNSREIK